MGFEATKSTHSFLGFSLAVLTLRFDATSGLFGNGPHIFEQWSGDKDDTWTGFPIRRHWVRKHFSSIPVTTLNHKGYCSKWTMKDFPIKSKTFPYCSTVTAEKDREGRITRG
ncbi:hypothetical protein AVEN_171302-1 [Araneus ventricosus]|uniref:Uncharacterized protein n=1 Tax=Araneus ventricosus TaxID=182803 RepID=A0A4Y2KGI6_ARAVE|nr:hypothetical protein AVEN_171302-1 [Araneus ventricosus]